MVSTEGPLDSTPVGLISSVPQTHSLMPLQDPDESITPLTHQEDPDTPRGLGVVMVQPQLCDPVPESVNSTANSP